MGLASFAAIRQLTLMAVLVGAPACREPTEAIVQISTDAACEDLAGTGVTVGMLGDIESAPFGTTSPQCTDGGTIGSIVLLPDEDDQAPFAFKVVTSLGAPIEECIAPAYGPTCIVARRALRFVPNDPIHVPILMSEACAGILCPADETCVDGQCQGVECVLDATCEEPPVAPPWVKHIGGPGLEMGRGVAAKGNVVAFVGNFDTTIDLGGGELQSNGGQDAFVAVYTPLGAHRWSTSFGGPDLDEATSVAIDEEANVYVLSSFSGSVGIGGADVKSAGVTDVVLAKFEQWGKLVWARRIGGGEGDVQGGVEVGADGTVYVVGAFVGAASFGDVEIEAAGGSDGFVASFTPSGDLRWAKALGGLGDDEATGVGVDAAGNVYVGGFFEEEGDVSGAAPLVAVGTADAFVASFDADGNARWAKSFGAKGRDLVVGLAAGADRVVITGSLANDATLGGTELDTQKLDGFVISFDGSGELEWSRVFGGPATNDQGAAVSFAPDGSVLVGGETWNGGAFVEAELDLGGIRNPFLAVLEPDGSLRWSLELPSTKYASVPGVAATPEGYAYVAGWLVGELALDDPPLESRGAEDALLARVAPP